MKHFLTAAWVLLFYWWPVVANAENWREEKGNHFIMYYDPLVSDQWASDVLRAAEGDYENIADQIGYTRYDNYWTWDDRAKIYIYSDRDSFIKKTGLPAWTAGISGRDVQLTNARVIASYFQEEDFIDGVLPHEITHLILHDFLGQSIPVWFDEAMAQLQENKKLRITRRAMPVFVSRNEYLPIDELVSYSVRNETDSKKVTLFYLQSISLLDFLINSYGNLKFRDFCLDMKNGQSFESGLERVYSPPISSLEELEKKWLSYMKSF